jgi:hypothetical protein
MNTPFLDTALIYQDSLFSWLMLNFTRKFCPWRDSVYHPEKAKFNIDHGKRHDLACISTGFRRYFTDPKKTLLPSSLEALARAKAAGYQLIIVTGRHHVAIHPFYQALALDTPAICCNGTYLMLSLLQKC